MPFLESCFWPQRARQLHTASTKSCRSMAKPMSGSELRLTFGLWSSASEYADTLEALWTQGDEI